MKTSLAGALLSALLAGCTAAPAPAGWADARVGDRVDLRYALDEPREEEPPRRVSLRGFVEVVKREGDVAWVRLGVRDAQGAPVAHPTVGKDLLVPVDVRPGDPRREELDVGGATLECELFTHEDDGAERTVTRVWRAPPDTLYPVLDQARRTRAVLDDGEVVRTTSLEVVALTRGPEPTALGALPADVPVLFEPEAWQATSYGDPIQVHRFQCVSGHLAYGATEVGLVDAYRGPFAFVRQLEGGGRLHYGPALGAFDAARAPHRATLVGLLESRLLAAASGEAESDPFVCWRREGSIVPRHELLPPPPPPHEPVPWSEARVGDRVDLSYARGEGWLRLFVEVVKIEADVSWLRLGVRDAEGRPLAAHRDVVLPMRAGTRPLQFAPEVGREPVILAGRSRDCAVHFHDARMVDGPVVRSWRPTEPAGPLFLVDGLLKELDATGFEHTTTVEVVAVRSGDARSGGALPTDALLWFEPGGWYVTDDGGGLVHVQCDAQGGFLSLEQTSLSPAGEDDAATIDVNGERYALPPRVTDQQDELPSWLSALRVLDVLMARAADALVSDEDRLAGALAKVVARGRY